MSVIKSWDEATQTWIPILTGAAGPQGDTGDTGIFIGAAAPDDTNKLWIDTTTNIQIGDVVGPTSATNENIAVFDGTSGKLIKEGASAQELVLSSDVDRIVLVPSAEWPPVTEEPGVLYIEVP